MLKNMFGNKFTAVTAILVISWMFCSNVFAWGGGWGHDRGGRYYYHEGRWHRPGWFFFDVAVPALVIGAIVETLPPRHTVVVAQGATYYYYDGVYYRPCPDGYVVAPAPVVVQQPAPVVVAQPQNTAADNVMVNVPNSDGSFTPVTLVRHKDGYLGPQGEFYKGHPTVDQLKTLYGK